MRGKPATSELEPPQDGSPLKTFDRLIARRVAWCLVWYTSHIYFSRYFDVLAPCASRAPSPHSF
jgi:hypothetical protein